jgi:hypothetical protein
MPRRRFITIGRLTATVVVVGIIAVVAWSQKTPEAYYQGHSASYWLSELLGANQGLARFALAADMANDTAQPLPSADRGPGLALEAFANMGTNADPVLVAALVGRESPLMRLYRDVWARMPTSIQQHLPMREQPGMLRMEAVIVFERRAPTQPMPDLYAMLKEPDSDLRLAVLDATRNRAANASQLPLLILAARDPDMRVRSEVWRRLGRMGALADDSIPTLLKFCEDSNPDVRQEAAWALWNITGKTNIAITVTESVLSQRQDANSRHKMAYHLLMMGDSAPFFVTTLINSLTNSSAGDRAIICSFLGQIGPPAAAAIPGLRKALQDPEPEVRRRAEVALSRIEPEHSATNSP